MMTFVGALPVGPDTARTRPADRSVWVYRAYLDRVDMRPVSSIAEARRLFKDYELPFGYIMDEPSIDGIVRYQRHPNHPQLDLWETVPVHPAYVARDEGSGFGEP